jgi:DNA repair photolyase
MRSKLVVVPNLVTLINASPGFLKKGLSHFKIDLQALCEFGCSYCSSNTGNYLRMRRKPFADLTEQQLGVRSLPTEDPYLTFGFTDVVEQLARELHRKPRNWGAGQTLMISMLTDAFSPRLVAQGITRAALELLIKNTGFRIRVLTKNCVIGKGEWVEFFLKHRDRFVVGLSTGTLDDGWARAVEIGTSSPSARLRALRALQDAGVPTFGMACPIFPDVVATDRLDDLIDAIRPEKVETFWAEPYNDRLNWERVRAGYQPSSPGYEMFTEIYGQKGNKAWSRYATDLYLKLRARAEADGWIEKLTYLLYEERIVKEDVPHYASGAGLLLQSIDKKKRSKNQYFRAALGMVETLAGGDGSTSDGSLIDGNEEDGAAE